MHESHNSLGGVHSFPLIGLKLRLVMILQLVSKFPTKFGIVCISRGCVHLFKSHQNLVDVASLDRRAPILGLDDIHRFPTIFRFQHAGSVDVAGYSCTVLVRAFRGCGFFAVPCWAVAAPVSGYSLL